MWSFHEDENEFLRTMWLRGDIDFDSTLDFVYPVYTSLSGNKSDRYMKRSYTQKVTQWEQCRYDVDFQIKSTHDMWKRKREAIEALVDEYSLDSANLLEIQWAARNRQFVRVLFPKQAQIKPQAGMEVVDYGSRKWAEFFLETQLQESSYYNISYFLENTDCRKYDFTFYRQAGIPSYDIQMDVRGDIHAYDAKKEDFYFREKNEK